MSCPNPWIDRYKSVLDPQLIRNRASIRAEKFTVRLGETIEGARQRLEKSLESLFVATDPAVDFIRSEISRAEAFARVNYDDMPRILKRIYEKNGPVLDPDDPLLEHSYPTLWTGLAGVGKSAVLDAIPRVIATPTEIDLGPQHGRHELEAYRLFKVQQQTSRKSIYGYFSRSVGCTWPIKASVDQMPSIAAAHLFRRGVCLLGVDEAQFLTQTSTAIAAPTALALGVSAIGRPWHFGLNYDMVWKFLARAQPITQRIFKRPRVLLPDLVNSIGWDELMREYDVVLQDVASFILADRKEDFWSLTVALKRPAIILLGNAYEHALCANRKKMDWRDVEIAYAASSYTSYRNDLEKLVAHATQGEKLPKHLECPFKEGTISVAKAEYARQLREIRKRDFVEKSTNSALNVEEKRKLGVVVALVGGKPEPSKAASKPKRAKLTVDGLQQAGRQFQERLNKSTGRRRYGPAK